MVGHFLCPGVGIVAIIDGPLLSGFLDGGGSGCLIPREFVIHTYRLASSWIDGRIVAGCGRVVSLFW